MAEKVMEWGILHGRRIQQRGRRGWDHLSEMSDPSQAHAAYVFGAGYGAAQGGTAEDLCHCFNEDGLGAKS